MKKFLISIMIIFGGIFSGYCQSGPLKGRELNEAIARYQSRIHKDMDVDRNGYIHSEYDIVCESNLNARDMLNNLKAYFRGRDKVEVFNYEGMYKVVVNDDNREGAPEVRYNIFLKDKKYKITANGFGKVDMKDPMYKFILEGPEMAICLYCYRIENGIKDEFNF